MPDAVAMQASPPSSAARRFWNIVTVGLVKREYVYASSEFLKRSAASAALEKQKLDVRKSASACSLNSLRKVPARTASVSKFRLSSMFFSLVFKARDAKKPAWSLQTK